MGRIYQSIAFLALVTSIPFSHAHDHKGDERIKDGDHISYEPIDTILWLHILSMILAFGILFPLGMVLGLTRNRFHVPVQISATCIAIMGWFLGHGHDGRQFEDWNIHSIYAPFLGLLVVSQVGMGVYLKLHLERGWHGRVRGVVVRIHKVIGIIIPVASWVQMIFGGITALGFCHTHHLGQCLAHFIMGGSFIAYAIVMTLMTLVGQAWLRRQGRAPEFWDSLIIAVWGFVNTFTEHRWGQEWSHGDYQHTSMGIVWWCAGLLGLWLSRGRNGEARRNLIPSIVIFLTGWAMSSHVQHLEFSTKVHAVFGYTLMAAGLSRLIEIAFVLRDRTSRPNGEPSTFQHLPPYLLIASGFLFMGANEEQLQLLFDSGVDHVSYLLVLYSLAFLLYLFVQILIYIYSSNTAENKAAGSTRARGGNAGRRRPELAPIETGRDGEEYELEGLISDDEERLESALTRVGEGSPPLKEGRA
ncbi:hypothetical protein TWF106_009279 [Orbilia oligospora]|uniref:Protein YTP1-like C-terminal domain-containing protein n=1 Tax=Orbilia oligospora TaxID=2813651 RepID=A0A7C8UGF1_ORBOL|nr:hypothetical protein TWF788_000522 [Orbilia oligospora]KAF3214220.1 hypothetical protein TWF106_009279 [Orbilia oligospora]